MKFEIPVTSVEIIRTENTVSVKGENKDEAFSYTAHFHADTEGNEVLVDNGTGFYSSNSITNIYYNASTKVLGIRFVNDSANVIYLYQDVHLWKFVGILTAKSVNEYWREEIKNEYHFTKVSFSEFLEKHKLWTIK